MVLKPNALGLTGAILTAVGYGLCSAWYALRPDSIMKLSSYISHGFDFTPIIGTGITWSNFFVGLAVWVVMSYVGLVLFAWLYNKLAR